MAGSSGGVVDTLADDSSTTPPGRELSPDVGEILLNQGPLQRDTPPEKQETISDHTQPPAPEMLGRRFRAPGP